MIYKTLKHFYNKIKLLPTILNYLIYFKQPIKIYLFEAIFDYPVPFVKKMWGPLGFRVCLENLKHVNLWYSAMALLIEAVAPPEIKNYIF